MDHSATKSSTLEELEKEVHHLRLKAMDLDAYQHRVSNLIVILSKKDILINTLEKDLLEANAKRVRLSSVCETTKSLVITFQINYADLLERFKSQSVDLDSQKEAFKKLDQDFARKLIEQDKNKPEGAKSVGTDREKSVKPQTPKGLRNQNSKSNDACASVKPIKGLDFSSSTFAVGENSKAKPNQPLASLKPNFQKSPSAKGGKSTSEKPSSNSHRAFNADARRKDGRRNVKPPGRDHPRKNNRFNAFPKRHRPSHTGSGHASPSVGFYSNMSVNRKHTLNNALDAFHNDMCSMFDNFLCNGVANSFNAYNSNAYSRKRKGNKKGNKNPSPSVKSPAPKEKSKKGTTLKTSVVTNPKTHDCCRAFLYDYVAREEGPVKLADKTRKYIKANGKITNGKYIIKNVRYVEGLEYNLFSSRQLCDNGYSVHQFMYVSTICDEDENIILKGRRTGHLYTTVFLTHPLRNL
ncbi:hypothetical protein OSB04_011423 [Centaurea solstitialis]|uniref:Uncharacterized protein n=1 Tax=Centaurea solstitialis TaxID=347529 RepID=A0AA38TB44_9ASTR|nr:hypothetical protein OSB04_011423 [Centaurea solstitialis]